MKFIFFLLVGMAYSQPGLLGEVIMQNRDTLWGFFELLKIFPYVLSALEKQSNTTILAPSNSACKAFIKIPGIREVQDDVIKNLFSYHVLLGTYPLSEFQDRPRFMPTVLNKGRDPQVVKAYRNIERVYLLGGSTNRVLVEKSDIAFDGGLIHVLNSFMDQPRGTSAMLRRLNLTSLTGGFAAAGMAERVDNMEGITVFAPKNSAFRTVGSALQSLSRGPLSDILAYHVVRAGHVLYSPMLGSKRTLKAINGKPLTVSTVNGSVFVNGARLLSPDVIMNNGVIHIVDGVLNPNNPGDKPKQPARTHRPSFPSATVVADDLFTTPTPSIASTIGQMTWSMSIGSAWAIGLAIILELAAS